MTEDDAWVDFAAGGGKSNFYSVSEVDSVGVHGLRMDGRDLIAEAANYGVMTAQTKDEFLSFDFSEG